MYFLSKTFHCYSYVLIDSRETVAIVRGANGANEAEIVVLGGLARVMGGFGFKLVVVVKCYQVRLIRLARCT